MLSGRPYHVGYLVEDLEQAMPRYGAVLGVEFRPPEVRALIREDGHPFEVLFTYSIGGPPYVELLQPTDGGPVFSAEQGEGFHHVGVWMSDPAAAQAEQTAAGAEIEGRFFTDDGTQRVWFTSAVGLRAELVNVEVRESVEAWLVGDPPAGDGAPDDREEG